MAVIIVWHSSKDILPFPRRASEVGHVGLSLQRLMSKAFEVERDMEQGLRMSMELVLR